jgi:hypothetical protein
MLMDNSVARCANEIIDICHELKALLSVNGAFDAFAFLEKVEASDDYDLAMEIRNKSMECKK